MIIRVKVKPQSSQSRVEKVSGNEYRVWVHASPEKGKANRAVIELLSKYLNIPKSRLKIKKGETNRLKFLEIL